MSCEIRGFGCAQDNYLGFAHTKKRRNVITEADLLDVVLACNPCHDAVEALGEDEMGRILRGIIDERERQPNSAKKEDKEL